MATKDDEITGTYILCVGILVILTIMAVGINHAIENAKQEIIHAIRGEASR